MSISVDTAAERTRCLQILAKCQANGFTPQDLQVALMAIQNGLASNHASIVIPAKPETFGIVQATIGAV